MWCARCHNKGWKPTKDFKFPIIAWKKETFDSHDARIKFCVQCGYVFRTIEKFEEEIETSGIKIMQLVDNYKEQRKSEKKISRQTRLNLRVINDE